MTRGKAFTEVGGQVRELPVERPIIGFLNIAVLFLGAMAHAFFEDVNNSVESVMAARVTLEVVGNLVTNRGWSEKRKNSEQR